jgi:hypothetical protein
MHLGIDRLGQNRFPLCGHTECRTPGRSDGSWYALMHPGLAEPLAEILETAAYALDTWLVSTGRSVWDSVAVDVAEGAQGSTLRVARVLLGVPDGR